MIYIFKLVNNVDLMSLDAPSIRAYCANVIDVVVPDMFNRVFVAKVGQPTTKSGREPVSQEQVKIIKSMNLVKFYIPTQETVKKVNF